MGQRYGLRAVAQNRDPSPMEALDAPKRDIGSRILNALIWLLEKIESIRSGNLFGRRGTVPRRFRHVLPHDDGRLFRFNFKMMDRAIGTGELDSEKQDRARIVDPNQQRDERAGRSVN